MRAGFLLFALFSGITPLSGHAQMGQATPVDEATARAIIAQAAQRYPKFSAALADVRQHDPLLRRFISGD